MKLALTLGIKRLRFRAQDPRSASADAEFGAKRSGVVSRGKSTCAACGYQSSTAGAIDVHHLDDDHHNNADSNLTLACHTCHPYQHVGELVRRVDKGTAGSPSASEGLGARTQVASVPEISAADLNLLQRAIGVALLDEAEAPIAREMVKLLAERASWVRADLGTCMPGDFAAAMAQLSDESYAQRHDAVQDLRLLFNDETLKKLGRQFVNDNPSLPVASWRSMGKKQIVAGGS